MLLIMGSSQIEGSSRTISANFLDFWKTLASWAVQKASRMGLLESGVPCFIKSSHEIML